MKKSNFWLLAAMLLLIGCTMDTPDTTPDSPKTENPYFVDIQTAIENADKFFSQLNGEPGTRTPKIVRNVEVYHKGNPLTRSSYAEPDFYLINYDEGGFALMSTDSRKLPVYAFSTEGHISLADTLHNEGLRNYLSVSATTGIIFPDTLPTPEPVIPNPVFPEIHVSILIPPMLDKNVRNWDQYGLNKYVCQKWKKDGIAVGCTAIATAQIMSYFRWPDRWPLNNSLLTQERHTFNWSEMLKTKYNDKTARLIEILSRPEHLNLNYDADDGEKGASRKSICSTFKNMGYNHPIDTNYNKQIALQTLYKKSPLIFTGKDLYYDQPNHQNINNHAWVVDGLAQGTVSQILNVYYYYYHFIWGNGGEQNGYYYYAESSKSFDQYAKEFDQDDDGYEKYDNKYGEIWTRWTDIHIITDFKVNIDLLN